LRKRNFSEDKIDLASCFGRNQLLIESSPLLKQELISLGVGDMAQVIVSLPDKHKVFFFFFFWQYWGLKSGPSP
jgi:hypothetical protein